MPTGIPPPCSADARARVRVDRVILGVRRRGPCFSFITQTFTQVALLESHCSDREAALRQLGARGIHLVIRHLSSYPTRNPDEPLVQRDLRFVPEHPPREPDVGEAVTDVADAVF